MAVHTEHSTTERLRHDIDRGRARDKVDASDPAAAPLGTDSEAGGHTPAKDNVAQARALEVTAEPPARTTFAPFAYVVFIVVLLAIALLVAVFATG